MTKLHHYIAVTFLALSITFIHLIKRKAKAEAFFIYCKKAINLSICYIEFHKKRSLRKTYKTAQVAFLCSIYDYSTDFIKDKFEYKAFISKACTMCEPETIAIIDDLRKKEITSSLENAGLERGWLSLEFIILFIGIENEWFAKYSKTELIEIGEYLQLLDDVLDYEHDIEHKDLNCLIEDFDKYKLKITPALTTLKSIQLFSHKNAIVMNRIFDIVAQKELPLRASSLSPQFNNQPT